MISYQLEYIYVGLFCLVISFSTCVSPFDFDAEAMRSSLVIAGQLTDGNNDDLVTLSRTFDFDRARGKPVNGATIAVVDANGNRGIYAPVFDGTYQLDKSNFPVQVGQSYHLEITLEGGKRYESTPQTMPARVVADSLHVVFTTESNINSSGGMTEQKVIQIQVTTPLPAQTFMRWEMDEWYDFTEFQCSPISPPSTCYIQVQEFEQLLELEGNSNSEDSYLINRFVANKPLLFSNTREFESRHYFNVYQYTLSREVFEFWSTAKSVTQQEGTIFDAPPAVIPGNLFSPDNLTEQVRGVFEVAAIDTIRTSIIQTDVSQQIVIQPFCTGVSQECCDCRRIPMSSREKPRWF